MIWWIIGICLFFVIVVFMFMFVNGADQRKRDDNYRVWEDNEQEETLTKIREEQSRK